MLFRALVILQGTAARFASLDGCIASTDGKFSFVRFTEADKQNNALAVVALLLRRSRKRSGVVRITKLHSLKMAGLESELRQAQTASLKLSESLANLKGQSESARRDADASVRAAEAARR